MLMKIGSGPRGVALNMAYSVSVGMEDKDLWAQIRVTTPSGTPITRCRYISFIGDIPKDYKCMLNSATEVARLADGGIVYQKTADFLTSTITVDDNCIPVSEVVDLDVNKIIQQRGGAHLQGFNVRVDMSLSTFEREPSVSASVADHRKPSDCMFHDRVVLPPVSEGGPEGLIREEVVEAAGVGSGNVNEETDSSSRRKRATVDSVKETLARVARDTLTDMADFVATL